MPTPRENMSSSRKNETLLFVLYTALVAIAAFALLSVPVRAFAAEIEMPVPMVVVYPGQNVVDKGLGAKVFRIKAAQLSAYAIEPEMLEGMVARRTLLPGKPIMMADLKTPDIVKAGVGTTMVYREAGLVITSLGTPLQSAAEGETIRIRNSDSGVVVTGIVEPDGTIRIGQ